MPKIAFRSAKVSTRKNPRKRKSSVKRQPTKTDRQWIIEAYWPDRHGFTYWSGRGMVRSRSRAFKYSTQSAASEDMKKGVRLYAAHVKPYADRRIEWLRVVPA